MQVASPRHFAQVIVVLGEGPVIAVRVDFAGLEAVVSGAGEDDPGGVTGAVARLVAHVARQFAGEAVDAAGVVGDGGVIIEEQAQFGQVVVGEGLTRGRLAAHFQTVVVTRDGVDAAEVVTVVAPKALLVAPIRF